MSIADQVIMKCGNGSRSRGIKLVAMWTGRTPKTVYCWTYPRTRGGTDGNIPAEDQRAILRCARAAGIDLRPEDFFGFSDLPTLGTPANDNAAALPATTMQAVGDGSNANPATGLAETIQEDRT